MVALSDNRQTRQMPDPSVVLAGVGAAQHIFQGSLVCAKGADGYHYPGADTAGYIFAGIAREECDNSLGLDGALECKLYTKGRYLMVASGASQAWVMRRAYISDDQTVALSGTNGIMCGFIARIESSTAVWVEIAIGAGAGESYEMPSGTAAAPGLPYLLDADAGFYLAAANTVGIAGNGAGIATFGPTAVTLTPALDVSAAGVSAGHPSLYRATLVVPFNLKATTVVLAGADHPKLRVVGVNFLLTEVPDASATTLTCKLTRTVGGAQDICADKTFTQGTDTVGKVLAGTIDTAQDNIPIACDVNLVVGGTTTTLGRGVAYIDVVGE